MTSQLPDLQRPCPVCQAGPGQRCRALNQKAYAKPRKTMHPERRGERTESIAAVQKKVRAARPEDYRRDNLFPARVPHGTYARYHGGCRCSECRRAHTAYELQRREKLRGTLQLGDPRHGTKNAYTTYGCRCAPCVEAHRAYVNALRERTRLAVSRAVSQ